MSNNVSVKFTVSGSDLSNYIQEIQSKSDKLTATAISGAIEQTKKGKEQISLINEQITAIDKKNRIEAAGIRSIALTKRDHELNVNKNKYDGIRESIYSDPKLAGNDNLIKEKINATTGREKVDEEKIKNNYKENLTVARETERQAKIQTSLSKETIETLKLTAKENVKAIVSGDMKLVDVMRGANTEEEKLIARLTEEGVSTEKKLQAKESVGGKGGGIFSGMLGIDSLNKFISSATQLTQTTNGFDMVAPASGMAGRIIGALLGGIIGGVASGGTAAAAGAAAGSTLVGSIAEFFGAKISRELLTKQDYFKAAYKYNAITGQDSLGGDEINMSGSGVSYTDFIGMRSEAAKRRGYAKDSLNTARDAVYLDKGYGVDQGTSGSLIELQRSAREGNRDLANLVGSILQKGNGNIFNNGDHSYLNEFLGKFIGVQKDLLKTQTIAATGTTMDILSKFNNVGGEFASRDSRSAGNIQALQESLSKPGSDNLKALSFSVLRKNMPNASIFDILSERQKGLGSSTYLKGMLGEVENLGGDESQQMLNMSGMFPGLSLAAVRTLFKNRKGLMNGSISTSELSLQTPIDFKEKSESNTNEVDKSTANIINGILGGNTLGAMTDAITSAINDGFNGVVVKMDPVTGKLTSISRPTILKQNIAMKATKAKEIEANIIQRDNDVHSIGN